MKNIFVLTIALFLTIFSLNAKISISAAVLDFEKSSSEVSNDDVSIIENMFRTALFKNVKSFEIISRKNVEKILKEQKFQLTGATESSKLAQIGKILNVEKIVAGNVNKSRYTYFVEIQIIDVSTGKIEFIEQISGNDREDIYNNYQKIMQRFIQEYPVTGEIVKIIDDYTCYADIGTEDGVQKDFILSVIRTGEKIKDLSGNVIGETSKILGTAKVAEAGKNHCKLNLFKAFEIKISDKVKVQTNVVGYDLKEESKEVKEESKPVIEEKSKPKEKIEKDESDDFLDSSPPAF